MKLAFGSDHAAHATRGALLAAIRGLGHEVSDLGWEGAESVDYPDFAKKVGQAVVSGAADFGLLICGAGEGMCIAANKVRGIRAALCIDRYSAEMSRRHNDANVCCLRAREQTVEENAAIVRLFLDTEFEGGRHEQRILKIRALEDAAGETR